MLFIIAVVFSLFLAEGNCLLFIIAVVFSSFLAEGNCCLSSLLYFPHFLQKAIVCCLSSLLYFHHFLQKAIAKDGKSKDLRDNKSKQASVVEDLPAVTVVVQKQSDLPVTAVPTSSTTGAHRAPRSSPFVLAADDDGGTGHGLQCSAPVSAEKSNADITAEEYKSKLAERRRQARQKAEREAEEERQHKEELEYVEYGRRWDIVPFAIFVLRWVHVWCEFGII